MAWPRPAGWTGQELLYTEHGPFTNATYTPRGQLVLPKATDSQSQETIEILHPFSA